jgi:hypothetical protein
MDSFMHNHQSALDSQREDDAIQYLQDTGVYPDPEDIAVGDYVQTTEEYDSLCSISGEVIEDYGNKVVIIDDSAETDDDRLEFYKSDLQILKSDPDIDNYPPETDDDYEPTDYELMSSYGTAWHDWL